MNNEALNTKLGQLLASLGFATVKDNAGIRDTPLYANAAVTIALAGTVPSTGIIGTFSDAAGSAWSNPQAILAHPGDWVGFITGVEVVVESAITPAEMADVLQSWQVGIVAGGVTKFIPFAQCARMSSLIDNAAAPSANGDRSARYDFLNPQYWAGDGSEAVNVYGLEDITIAAPHITGLILHGIWGNSKSNNGIADGFGGPNECARTFEAGAMAGRMKRNFLKA